MLRESAVASNNQPMKNPMKTTLTAITACVAMMSLVACDNAEETARKKALEAQAEQIEAQAAATRKMADANAEAAKANAKANAEAQKNAGDAAAKTTEKVGEKQADALEDKADAVRDAK